MDKAKFIQAVKDAGWRDTADAQWEGIEQLYDDLIAPQQAEIEHRDETIRLLQDQTDKRKIEIEALKDALDHIQRTCARSRENTRRIKWVEQRAKSALEGNDDWKSVDMPRNDTSVVRLLHERTALQHENEALRKDLKDRADKCKDTEKLFVRARKENEALKANTLLGIKKEYDGYGLEWARDYPEEAQAELNYIEQARNGERKQFTALQQRVAELEAAFNKIHKQVYIQTEGKRIQRDLRQALNPTEDR